ncbi:MAG: SIR2 family protein [Kiritimatiellia bacterium]
MPNPDDFTLLRKTEFTSAIDKFEELMTQSGRAFLLGAGCSKCAGLPLTAELTEKALNSDKLCDKSKEILSAIQSNFAGAMIPNIEDFLSELVDLTAIADRRKARSAADAATQLGGEHYSPEELHEAVEEIKQAIAKVINQNFNIEYHLRFVRAVHRPFRPGRPSDSQSVDYLVLNYDTLIESALALGKLAYADGLEGGAVAWWNPETFQRSGLSARVLKLHGSIDWSELPEDVFPRRIPSTVGGLDGNQQIMIWPASTKYRETQRDPYSQLSNIARGLLRPQHDAQRVLVICGYSFGDSHVNIEIDSALRESAGRLTIVVFFPDTTLSGQLKVWHEDSAVRDQLLVFGRRGFWHGDEVYESEGDLPWWKFENVVRILEGKR